MADSDEHRLLTALRASGLKDGAARKKFYDTVIQSLDMGEDNYLILLAYDRYDVPYHGKDGSRQADASDTVFPYILCTICPVKNGKPVLSYSSEEKEFHNFVSGSVVGTPELGFLFPTFDDRASNIYNALFYTRDPGGIHQEFIDGVFRTEPPMSAQEQRESFQSALVEALDESCSFDVVQSVHEQLRELLAAHKESKDPEPLELSPRELGGILTNCGVSEEGVAAFQEKCAQQFQGRELLQAANLIDSRRFEVKTAETKIAVEPEHSFVLETRIIDGRKYILVPADEGAEINGLSVRIPGKETE